MPSGRRLRTRSSIASAQQHQQQQLSDCGHDRSFLDFTSDRDIQCKICWENREILIQRLIEPFEHALETLKVDDNSAPASITSTPERASSAEKVGAVSSSTIETGRIRSLRRRAGQKRTRSVSPAPVLATDAAATMPMKFDGEDNLLGASKPDEEDCIHVQDISVAIPSPPEKKRSKSPEQARMVKIAALEPQKMSANIITPAAAKPTNPGGTTEKMQENPSPPTSTTPTPAAKFPKLYEMAESAPPALVAKPTKLAKPRASLPPPKKGQQTLFSFFARPPVPLPADTSTKIEESVTVKSETPLMSRPTPKSAPIFGGGGVGGGGVAKKKDVAAKATEEIVVVRKSTPPATRPSRAGTRKSARDGTVKSRETVNYREDSDSDIDLE